MLGCNDWLLDDTYKIQMNDTHTERKNSLFLKIKVMDLLSNQKQQLKQQPSRQHSMDALLCSFGLTLVLQRARTQVSKEEEGLQGSYNDLNKTVEYYDQLATDYDTVVVEKWGYKMPKKVAAMCANELQVPLTAKLLDLGCGSGLVGVEMRKLGYTGTMTGVDMSKTSLDVSKKRNIYQRLQVGNLSESLVPSVVPREGMFDLAMCVGTTSYLSPEVLAGWSKLIRPGGLIVLTHKTEVWKKWEPIQDGLVKDGILEHVMTSKELLYLPGFSSEGRNLNERAKIYCFRRPSAVGF